MKTKRSLENLVIVAVLLSTVLNFISCSKDDDKKVDPSNNPIAGTWRLNFEDEGYELYILNQDGTGSYEDWVTKDGKTERADQMDITYTYDSTVKELAIIEADGDIHRYEVIALTENRLVIRSKNSKSEKADTYIKQ